MNFLLTGVETNNKGAELMLYAILQEIELKFPGSKVYIEKNRITQGDQYVKTSLDLQTIENPFAKYINFFHINGILRRLHLPLINTFVKIPQIDYMIDGSGLHFTDKETNEWFIKYWGSIFRQARYYNAKIVFLPQAFGPIEKDYSKEEVRLLFEHADLVFAREQVSYGYLSEISGIDMTKLHVCSDFTSLVEGQQPMMFDHLKGAVCIIPNIQMVDKGIVTVNEYISYLQNIINAVSKQGKKVYLLNHEGPDDERLLNICSVKLGNRIEVVSGLNALETKGLISSAFLVITSRFHGVASALNTCVPCLATSWNHKYKCLFEDYSQQNCILTVKDIETDLLKIERFLDPNFNELVRKQLRIVKPIIRKQTENMWINVWNINKT